MQTNGEAESMKKIIDGVQFPEGNGATTFPSCFASAWMRVMGVTSEERAGVAKPPYGVCCGSCVKTNLSLYHKSVQNFYTVVSGLTFMQLDLSNEEHFSPWHINRQLAEYDDYIKFTMGFAGFTYERCDKSAGKEAVFEKIKESVDAGRPALANFGTGYAWYVITGYDDQTGTIYGMGDNPYWTDHFGDKEECVLASNRWHGHLAEAVVITGRAAPSVKYDDVFIRMTAILEAADETGYFKRSADFLADEINFEGYGGDEYLELAKRICLFIGLPVDSRDVGCSMKNLAKTEPFENKARYLMRIADLYNQNCEICQIAWDMAGSYKMEIEEPAKMLPSPLYRNAIANVIKAVVKNNRRVINCLKEMTGTNLTEVSR